MSEFLSTLHEAHVARRQRLFPVVYKPKVSVAPAEPLPQLVVTTKITKRKFTQRDTTVVEIDAKQAVSVRIPVSFRPNGLPSMAQVIAVVAQAYQIPVEKLRGKSRKPEFCRPRQIAMYLCREVLHESYSRIARAVGVTDHTTALHGHRRIAEIIRSDADFASDIPELEAVLTQ